MLEKTNAPSFWDRTKSALGFGRADGSWRGPFFGIGERGGIYSLGALEDGWQRNLNVFPSGAKYVPAVYACVMTIARAISQCYPMHVRETDDRIEHLRNTAAFRTLNRPNGYQTTPQFLLNMVAESLFEGEAIAVAVRNDRNEVIELHQVPRRSAQPYVAEDRSIYYQVGNEPLIPARADYIVPSRDVLHLRFYTPRHPLIGETPIKAASLAVGINVALSESQAAFFSQMNRPSGILSTEQTLTKEQMIRLREAFDEQSKRWGQGGMPILSNGLKFSAMSISNEDAQLIEAQRMSIEEICRVYGVPPALIGDLNDATLNNAETLMQFFMSISLGSYLENIERSFDRIFNLSSNEYVQLDTSALIRTDFSGRIEGLTKAVQGGLMTPDEARAREGLGPIAGGSSAYLQRQMVPMDKIGDLLDAETEAASSQQNEIPAQPLAIQVEPERPEDVEPEIAKALVISMMDFKRKSRK